MITCTARRDRSSTPRFLVSTLDDATLVRELAAGRQTDDVIAELHRRHAAPLRSALRRRFGDGGAAEDAVQETFVRLWGKAHLYDEAHGSVVGWLHGIAVRAAIDLHRKRGRSVEAVGADEPSLDAVQHERVEGFDRHVVDRHLVSQALLRLSVEHREVLFLAHQGGCTQSEIATILGVPLGTVKTRTYWAIQTLKRHLAHRAEVALVA